ncbi:Na+/H+ antiporter NhaC [Vitreoscilla stercoraria]|uniref:Na+/H+ antiporter NhaC n=1 Tax=Vitreoscilla stercoraria TaxID=61 RepID=A0ABY4EBC6_VITST|nr:Na+/H+ antiporter NhaC [Vitreoscilla stercoraria]UOO92653.1 Na+/H+ antiporter NhaC [Vitreoscilla stercoraria]
MIKKYHHLKQYPFWFDVTPLLITTAIMAVQFFIFKDFTPHIPLIIGICITGLFMALKGQTWSHMEKQMFTVMKVGLPAVLILMCVGMLISVWIAAGTVPTIVNAGLAVLSPSIFLPATCILACLVSLATGTSWGTVGTVGLAMMGIGDAMGIPLYWTAGAVVSGSFFGDKMSPLSDTTNLTPAVADVNLWDHIRGMLPCTVPALVISVLIYAYIGQGYSEANAAITTTDTIKNAMNANFQLGWLTLIPAAVVIYMGYRKYSAMGTICLGVALGALIAIFVQDVPVKDIFNILQNGYKAQTGISTVDSLLSKGGVMSMTWTVTLTMFSLAFVGALETYGTFDAILGKLENIIKSRMSLLSATYGSGLAVSLILGEVYTSLVLPGRLLQGKYKELGYDRTTLSRTLEDCGTLVSPLIPWNMGGGFVTATLGVPTIVYAPFAIFCWLSPLFGILYALTGWFVPRTEPVSKEQLQTARHAESLIS